MAKKAHGEQINMKRIAITGPESTGKSALARQLALHYQTSWVPEVARDYLTHLGRNYIFEDIVEISKKQLEMENSMAAKANDFLFCDTDFLVIRIWSKFKYGKCDSWVEDKINNHRYDLYLLCDIDLPWADDPLREHPDNRNELFEMYRQEIENLKVNYKVISGIGGQRLRNAILAVEEAFYCR
jgi:NadR type nicotinamide-nucleotide adenylyltransferase